MTKKRYIETDRVLSYEELKLRDKIAGDYFRELVKNEKVLTVAEFLHENPKLEQRLRETSLFGFPSNALFALLPFCSSFCNQVSRVFSIYSGDPNAKIVTGINESIALRNYSSSYSQNPLRAHHTWVEMKINGTDKVIDLADQRVYDKTDYYIMHSYRESDLAEIGVSGAILQDFTPYSFVCLANRLAELTSKKDFLLDGYDTIVFNLYINHTKMTGYEADYVILELEQAKKRLEQAGIKPTSNSDAVIIDRLASKNNYMFAYSSGVSPFLKQEQEFDPEKFEIFNAVFPKTKEMAKTSSSLQGPLEWIGLMNKQFE